MLVGTLDAISLLASSHRTLETLLAEYATASPAQRGAIVTQLCDELAAHTALETGVLYPALDEAAGALMPARQLLATVRGQHDMLKAIAATLARPRLDEAARAASIGLLQMQLAGHIGLEEGHLYPLAKRTIGNLDALAEALEAAQAELGVEVALL